jgi:cytochrome c
MHKEEPKISCSTFQKQEPVIKDITDKINMAKGVQEKAVYAEELQKEVEALLSCPDYDKEKLDCESCHFIANLRKKTADLIIKAKKLA